MRDLTAKRNEVEVELTTRRTEFEQQLVAAGRKAEAAAKKLIDDATEQLADLNQRSELVRRESGKIMADARRRAQETVEQAERHAADLLDNSHNQARERGAEVEARTRAALEETESQLATLREQRDEIEAHIQNLRAMFAGGPFGQPAAPQAPAAAAPASGTLASGSGDDDRTPASRDDDGDDTARSGR